MNEDKHKQAYDSGKVCPHIELISKAIAAVYWILTWKKNFNLD